MGNIYRLINTEPLNLICLFQNTYWSGWNHPWGSWRSRWTCSWTWALAISLRRVYRARRGCCRHWWRSTPRRGTTFCTIFKSSKMEFELSWTTFSFFAFATFRACFLLHGWNSCNDKHKKSQKLSFLEPKQDCSYRGPKRRCLFASARPEVKQPTRCHFCHARPKGSSICFDSGSLSKSDTWT